MSQFLARQTCRRGIGPRPYWLSLGKGLLIVEDLANAGRPVALTELSKLAKLGKASSLLLVRMLQAIGLVVQDPDTDNPDGTWVSLHDQLRVWRASLSCTP